MLARQLSRYAALSLCMVVVACGSKDDTGSDTDTDPAATGASGNCNNGSLTADIDGSAWTASLAVCGVYESGIFNVTGSDSSGNQLAITVNGPSLGTNVIDGMQNTGRWNEVTTTFMVMMGDTQSSVTFDSIDDAGASGTFAFEALDVMTQEPRSVTNGTFSVTF